MPVMSAPGEPTKRFRVIILGKPALANKTWGVKTWNAV